jgi:hypothetical protein
MCTQQQLRQDDGNRFDEKSHETSAAVNGGQNAATRRKAQTCADSNDGFADEAGDRVRKHGG